MPYLVSNERDPLGQVLVIGWWHLDVLAAREELIAWGLPFEHTVSFLWTVSLVVNVELVLDLPNELWFKLGRSCGQVLLKLREKLVVLLKNHFSAVTVLFARSSKVLASKRVLLGIIMIIFDDSNAIHVNNIQRRLVLLLLIVLQWIPQPLNRVLKFPQVLWAARLLEVRAGDGASLMHHVDLVHLNWYVDELVFLNDRDGLFSSWRAGRTSQFLVEFYFWLLLGFRDMLYLGSWYDLWGFTLLGDFQNLFRKSFRFGSQIVALVIHLTFNLWLNLLLWLIRFSFRFGLNEWFINCCDLSSNLIRHVAESNYSRLDALIHILTSVGRLEDDHTWQVILGKPIYAVVLRLGKPFINEVWSWNQLDLRLAKLHVNWNFEKSLQKVFVVLLFNWFFKSLSCIFVFWILKNLINFYKTSFFNLEAELISKFKNIIRLLLQYGQQLGFNPLLCLIILYSQHFTNLTNHIHLSLSHTFQGCLKHSLGQPNQSLMIL